MTTNFESIYASLFASSSALYGFNLMRRRVIHWADLDATQFPALLQGQTEEIDTAMRLGEPSRWHLKAAQYIYVRTNADNDNTIDPAQLLNPILGSIRTAFSRVMPGNNLGGLVSHCWITKIEMMEGVLGPVEAAIVRFSIIVP